MNIKINFAAILIFIFALIGCNAEQRYIVVSVQNTIDENRTSEIMEIKWTDILSGFKSESIGGLQLVDLKTGKNVVHQVLDYDLDGTFDQMIFQSDFAPNESKSFKLINIDKQAEIELEQKVFGRFVPERKDDFAWESDRIAFRMYGPALAPTGTVNSGVDVWTKSVKYPIINKWYGGKENSYHKDHGEGLDFYHVGNSRGCGGLGIWEDDELYTSSTYESWKIISEGPIRFVFELSFAPWEVKAGMVSEVKRISIDSGHNLNRFESFFYLENDKSESEQTYAVGLAIHENQGTGEYRKYEENGVYSFWEPATEGNGNLGTSIVIDPKVVQGAKSTEDHHFIIAKTNADYKAIYYAGAGWDKSEDFSDAESWDKYLLNFANCQANPVKISISGKQ